MPAATVEPKSRSQRCEVPHNYSMLLPELAQEIVIRRDGIRTQEITSALVCAHGTAGRQQIRQRRRKSANISLSAFATLFALPSILYYPQLEWTPLRCIDPCDFLDLYRTISRHVEIYHSTDVTISPACQDEIELAAVGLPVPWMTICKILHDPRKTRDILTLCIRWATLSRCLFITYT